MLKRGISNLPVLKNDWVSPVSSPSMQAKHKNILQISRAPETSQSASHSVKSAMSHTHSSKPKAASRFILFSFSTVLIFQDY